VQIITRVPGSPAVQCEVKDKNLEEFASLVQTGEPIDNDNGGSGWSTDVVRVFRNRDTRQATDGLAAWICDRDDSLPTLNRVFSVCWVSCVPTNWATTCVRVVFCLYWTSSDAFPALVYVIFSPLHLSVATPAWVGVGHFWTKHPPKVISIQWLTAQNRGKFLLLRALQCFWHVQEVPEHVGFDIEVKMTVPDHVPFTSSEEIDRVVGPIVACVEAACSSAAAAGRGSRTIVYSSFDPDVCVALAQRQSRWLQVEICSRVKERQEQ
jgi:hypothetical protein